MGVITYLAITLRALVTNSVFLNNALNTRWLPIVVNFVHKKLSCFIIKYFETNGTGRNMPK